MSSIKINFHYKHSNIFYLRVDIIHLFVLSQGRQVSYLNVPIFSQRVGEANDNRVLTL